MSLHRLLKCKMHGGYLLVGSISRGAVRVFCVFGVSIFSPCLRFPESAQVSSHSPKTSAQSLQPLWCSQMLRSYSTKTDGENQIAKILKEKFPLASSLKVVDISGGCGAMYEIHIESNEFKGKRTVQQHQLVNQALKDEIKAMHGLRIFTIVPEN